MTADSTAKSADSPAMSTDPSSVLDSTQNSPGSPETSTDAAKSTHDDGKSYTMPIWELKDDIVISGISGRFPESNSVEELKKNLFEGIDMMTENDRRWRPGLYGTPKRTGKLKEIDKFDMLFFGVHGKQAETMDPMQRLMLETVYEAVFDAGIAPSSLRGKNIGVYMGCSERSISGVEMRLDLLLGYELLGQCLALLANRISFAFDFKGPSFTLDTACSSTLYAMNEAVLAIRSNRCDAAIVGGANIILNPSQSISFARLGLTSKDGTCRVFDANANGYVRAEGVGAFLLQRSSDARRCYGTVLHCKANNDGFKPEGVAYPSAIQHKQLYREVWSELGLDPATVGWVEAHGTGTVAGDREESNAVAEFFCENRDTPLLVGSVKSNLGHGEAASGNATIAKLILSLEEGVIPPNLNYSEPNPQVPALVEGKMKVVTECTPWTPRLVAANNFGFGGSNVHLVLKANSVEKPERKERVIPRLVLASGRTEESVQHIFKKVQEEQFTDEAVVLLEEACRAPTLGMRCRGYALLQAPGEELQPVIERSTIETRPLWFLFSGMGSQWPGMAKEMMKLDLFRNSILESARILKPLGVDLLHLLCEATEEELNNIIVPFVTIAAVQIALFDLMKPLKIIPDGIIGHSVGELGCAYADGCITAEQMLMSAYWRGMCCVKTELIYGAMAVVGLTWEETEKRCPEGVFPACHNAEDSITISGPAEKVKCFVDELKAENIFAKEVRSCDIAFHCKYVEPASHLMKTELSKVILEAKPRSAKWVSSSVPEAEWNEPHGQLFSVDYQVNNLLSPVLFNDAMSKVPKNAIIIEFAPHSLLQPIVKRILGPEATYIGLMKRQHEDNLKHFLGAIGKMYNVNLNPRAKNLYEPVSFPVPRGTAMLNSLIKWDHSNPLLCWSFHEYHEKKEIVPLHTLKGYSEEYLTGHKVDGRVLFPFMGYIMLAWRALANHLLLEIDEVPVIFQDIGIFSASLLPKNGRFDFLVKFLDPDGNFRIVEGKTTVAKGRAIPGGDTPLLMKDPSMDTSKLINLEESFTLDAKDFYKELRLRGYEYGPTFQGVLNADATGLKGNIKWDGRWTTFMDAMLQIPILCVPVRALLLPTRIKSIRVDPRLKPEKSEEGIPFTFNPYINVSRCGPVEIQGMHCGIAPKRVDHKSTPVIEEQTFSPLYDFCILSEDEERNVEEYSHVCSTLAHKILEEIRSESPVISSFKNGFKDAPEELVEKYLKSDDKRYGMLKVLKDVLYPPPPPADEEVVPSESDADNVNECSLEDGSNIEDSDTNLAVGEKSDLDDIKQTDAEVKCQEPIHNGSIKTQRNTVGEFLQIKPKPEQNGVVATIVNNIKEKLSNKQTDAEVKCQKPMHNGSIKTRRNILGDNLQIKPKPELNGVVPTIAKNNKGRLYNKSSKEIPSDIDNSEKNQEDMENNNEEISKDTPKDLIEMVKEVFTKHKTLVHNDLLNTVPLKEKGLRSMLDVVLDNQFSMKFQVTELSYWSILRRNVCRTIGMTSLGMMKPDYTVARLTEEPIPDDLEPGLKPIQCDLKETPLPAENDLLVAKDLFTDSGLPYADTLLSLASAVKNKGFILLVERTDISPAEKFLSDVTNRVRHIQKENVLEQEFERAGLTVIAKKKDQISSVVYLLRKLPVSSEVNEVCTIEISNHHRFSWVEELKLKLKEFESRTDDPTVWLVANGNMSGVVGLVNCLKLEPGGKRLRYFFDSTFDVELASRKFNISDPFFRDILKKDLVFNVVKDGQLGMFRHQLVDSEPVLVNREYAFLNVTKRGDLSSFKWIESSLMHHKPDARLKDKKNTMVHVYYSSLNFRDVMLATGRLPPDVIPREVALKECLLGLEFVGKDDTGRRVMGLTFCEGVATAVRVPEDVLMDVPEEWTLEEASTVPVAYMTAYYALVIRGCMKKGNSVLIHAGAGAVGQAAIRIALSMECEVYVTVGSEEKREFLKETFPALDDTHFSNSRDVQFEFDILNSTKGKGVDIVLNSLADDKLQASVRCLKSGGRFLEIGKYDIAMNNPLGMSVFLNNITFHGVHLDTVMVDEDDGIYEEIKRLLDEGLKNGVVRPLKANVYQKDCAEDAFRFLVTGKHIGKVVIQIREEESDRAALPVLMSIPCIPRTYCHHDKSYLVTGGLGGFGLELANWLVEKGAKFLVLSSRSGVRDGYQKLWIERWKREGVQVLVSHKDISTREGAAALLKEAQDMGPVGGIFHLAMVLRDGLFENLTEEHFEEVILPKVKGVEQLDSLSRVMCPDLDYFVVFSSISCGRGNPGQSNYGYANSVMERVVEQRKHQGFPGLAIQWGGIGDVGVVYEKMGGNEVLLKGTVPQRLNSCLAILERFMQEGKTIVSSLVPLEQAAFSSGSNEDMIDMLCKVLGIKDPSTVKPEMTLGELGMDSLMAVEIKQVLESDYDTVMSVQEIRQLSRRELEELAKKKGATHKFLTNNDESEGDLMSPQEIPIPTETIIPLNRLTGTRNVFFVHPFDGHTEMLKNLALRINLPSFGLQFTANVPHDSIRTMAEFYVQRIRSVQPFGPYHLVGYSYGSLVAYEMALLLQKTDLVKTLVCIDGSPTATVDWMNNYFMDDEMFESKNPSTPLKIFCKQYLKNASAKINQDIMELSPTDPPSKGLVILKASFNLRFDEAYVQGQGERLYKLCCAARSYKAEGKYKGRITLIKATDERQPDEVGIPKTEDYGLRDMTDGLVEIFGIKCSHDGIVEDKTNEVSKIINDRAC